MRVLPYALRVKGELTGANLTAMAGTVDDKDLEKLRKLEARKAKVDADIQRRQAAIKEKARKRRSKLLLRVGRLAETAGVLDIDPAVLLGGLLELADTIQDKKTCQRLKRKGDRALKKGR